MNDRRRSKRVASLIQSQISRFLYDKCEDPRIKGTTITTVEVSADLRSARIFFASENSKEAIKGLKHASGFIRRSLGRELELRFSPELTFIADDHSKKVDHLMELFDEIKDDARSS